MILDQTLMMSSAQAVTATAPSSYSLDWGTTLRNIGRDEPVELVVRVGTTADAVGAATVAVALQDSADNNTFATVVETPAISKAMLTAGHEALRIRLPGGLRRYIQILYTVASGPLTAGTFTAGLVLDREDQRYHHSGFNVAA